MYLSGEKENLRESVVEATKTTGILPCIKLPKKGDFLAYADAMYEGGARVVEVTMTTPGALKAIETISSEFSGKLFVAAGTVLDQTTAREVILHGGSLIVSPTVVPEVIRTANTYCIPVYSGAFTATECLSAMQAGASMVKIFPAHVGGPKYMTNLKMVFPEINLIPSGGINLDNAAEFIRYGAVAVSGARTFMNFEKISSEGIGWITKQVKLFIELIAKVKSDMQSLP
jgi:2-dehydro-3-deoxyphosphogluconate aldolase/(4S)-4-hydroxy-2-oxoglutarate aldolase